MKCHSALLLGFIVGCLLIANRSLGQGYSPAQCVPCNPQATTNYLSQQPQVAWRPTMVTTYRQVQYFDPTTGSWGYYCVPCCECILVPCPPDQNPDPNPNPDPDPNPNPNPNPDPNRPCRQSISRLSAQQLESLKRGVQAMKQLPDTDPRSWAFQANIHGVQGTATNPLFNQCQHGTLYFLVWHRGYLHYFEKILREMSGDPSLMLPYWDWTNEPALPISFRFPADSSNPLFDSTRLINGGSALPNNVVDTDLENALQQIQFAQSGVGFSPQLEDSPHGAVHVFVGGNMGQIGASANDPIFWLHHCNVDRLWDAWLSRAGGRVNPSDSAFLDHSFSYADSNGATVTRTVRELLSSEQLGYCYEGQRAPTIQVAAAPQPTPLTAFRAATSVRTREVGREQLGFGSSRVRLQPEPRMTAQLREVPTRAARGAPEKLLLVIRGISANASPSFTYAVYLDLPEGRITEDQAKPYYIGTINFFGKTRGELARHQQLHGHAGHGGMQQAGETFDQTFDVTSVVARLQQAGRWDPTTMSVFINPTTVRPAAGQENEVRQRAIASAERAQVSYDRIELLHMQPAAPQ